MALQSSGAISLNDIHVEAGGSSGTTASINDSDIRGLINKASGATMSFSEWYGASAGWQSTLTVATYTLFKLQYYGYSDTYGGSMSDTTVDTYGNREIFTLQWGGNTFSLQFVGTQTNSGWTSISVGSTTFNRTAASFGNNTWSWSTSTNPFGTTVGATRTITFVV